MLPRRASLISWRRRFPSVLSRWSHEAAGWSAFLRAAGGAGRYADPKDGTHIKGRWWSADAGQIHFLVDNQLHQYARPDVSAVTFGDEDVAASPAARYLRARAHGDTFRQRSRRACRQRACSRSRAALAARCRAAFPAKPPAAFARRGDACFRAGCDRQRAAGRRGGVFRKGRSELVALEKSEAIERKSRSTTYWEMRGAARRCILRSRRRCSSWCACPRESTPRRSACTR